MKQLSSLQPSLNGRQGLDLVLSKSLTHIQYNYTESSSPQNLIDLNALAPLAISKTGGVFSGRVQVRSVMSQIFYPTIADEIVSINLSFGSYFLLDLNSDVGSFEILNVPPQASAFTLIMKQSSQTIHTVNFIFSGSVVKWANNNPPYAIVSGFGHIDMFSFSSMDQGATWLAQILGQDFKTYNT